MFDAAVPSNYSGPPVYTMALDQTTLGSNGLDKNGEAGKKLSASMKAVSLGPLPTVDIEPFECMVNLQECSPLSSQPSSPESSTDLDEPRLLTHTCSSLIPSLLIDNPEQVLYTLEDNERARRASKVYQNFLCEEPIMLGTRSEAYQRKYLRYINKIATIDRIDHLSEESLVCLESYLSPCYRRNGVHFIKAYQKGVKEERIKKAQYAMKNVSFSPAGSMDSQSLTRIEPTTPNLSPEPPSENADSQSPSSWKELSTRFPQPATGNSLARHLISSERSPQESDKMCLDV